MHALKLKLSPVCLSLGLLLLAGASGLPTADAQLQPPRRAPVARTVPAQELEDRVLQLFPLKFMEADSNLVRRLTALLPRATLAADERTNTLIVQSEAEQLERAKELLSLLDVPVTPRLADPVQRDRQVRIVWLMSGLQQAGAVPEDMQPIVEELGNYGVGGLGLVTQTIVRGRETFTTTAYPDLDGRSVRLEIEGTFSSQEKSGENAQMAISLTASTDAAPAAGVAPPGVVVGAPPARESLAELHTTVLAPFGHPVVLCMTPVKKMTSVFIVQVLLAR